MDARPHTLMSHYAWILPFLLLLHLYPFRRSDRVFQFQLLLDAILADIKKETGLEVWIPPRPPMVANLAGTEVAGTGRMVVAQPRAPG